ncbi:ribosomal RNA-processing protein 7 homolog A [Microplitis mediator]|uniref:ribosomal RNA-processing protein 7 homolog A n=1 Tax=Microplitis mediator TaxID=375433 RepID=UPI002556957B|nr:ribosomal RNA-processing protein 7 homolog A [Microplitis mediator]
MIAEEKSIGNYRTLWLKCEATSSDRHQLFLKEHNVRKQEPEFPKGRTLFVLNVPPYATLSSIKAAFARHCGNVKFVKLMPGMGCTKGGFKVAYIVFSKESELEKALSLPKDFIFVLSSAEAPCLFGVQKWAKEYNSGVILNEKEAKESIEKYMAAYDKRVEAENNDEEEDADGWVTVSSKKKRGQFAPKRKESTIEKVQTAEVQKSKKKKLENFYTFQIREAKKQQLAELRKKFELDKQKLQQLKAQRIFKPFG